jgi:hypothetical protein
MRPNPNDKCFFEQNEKTAFFFTTVRCLLGEINFYSLFWKIYSFRFHNNDVDNAAVHDDNDDGDNDKSQKRCVVMLK